MGLQPDDARQPYVQIADDLREAIRLGRFEPGAKLPSARELMEEYGVASTTAQRSLGVLRSDGLVTSIQGRGTFVRTDVDATAIGDSSPADVGALMQKLADLTDEVRQLDRRVTNIESTGTRQRRADST